MGPNIQFGVSLEAAFGGDLPSKDELQVSCSKQDSARGPANPAIFCTSAMDLALEYVVLDWLLRDSFFAKSGTIADMRLARSSSVRLARDGMVPISSRREFISNPCIACLDGPAIMTDFPTTMLYQDHKGF